jgi:hypothetical protein
MTLTVGDLITDAMTEIGVLASGETASAADSTHVMGKLNQLFGLWNTEDRYVYVIDSEEFAFGTSKQYYTIGPSSADFVTTRPLNLEPYCNLIIVGTTNFRRPLPLYTVSDWSAIGIPTLTSTFPTKVYYKPSYPNGTLYPWPYPTDVTNKLELFTTHQLAEVSSLVTTLALPPGYRAALTLSLAEFVSNSFGKQVTEDLRDFARKARASIAGANASIPRQTSDVPLTDRGGGMRWDAATRGWI